MKTTLALSGLLLAVFLIIPGSFYVSDILRTHSELYRLERICSEFPNQYRCPK